MKLRVNDVVVLSVDGAEDKWIGADAESALAVFQVFVINTPKWVDNDAREVLGVYHANFMLTGDQMLYVDYACTDAECDCQTDETHSKEIGVTFTSTKLWSDARA